MVVATDVMNLVVSQVPKAKQINVYHTAVARDVMNLVVKQAHETKPINV
jgi:GH35 family endo-1,4-beta-xylanase